MHHGALHEDGGAFQREFERIIADAGDGVADFTRFVFPGADYFQRRFVAECDFSLAKFTEDVDFGQATFTQGVHFVTATFARAHFNSATFTERADFSKTTFTKTAMFRNAKFMRAADFFGATFEQDADFADAGFAEAAKFAGATFAGRTLFLGTQFAETSNFSSATFAQAAFFIAAVFTKAADFSATTFTELVSFGAATFKQGADFGWATFARAPEFARTKFDEVASFAWAKFLARADFRETRFRNDDTREPGPVFAQTEFSNPEEVRFYRTYLGQALFHNCDVSKVNFSSVEWRRRRKGIGGKRMAFEEDVSLESGVAQDLSPSGDRLDARQYGLIEQLYRQLEKNYDENRDYSTAGDFHYGKMEMKRLSVGPPGRLARLFLGWMGDPRMNDVRRWIHQKLGLAAWYRRASAYGESYLRPAVWLVAVLILFGTLYPIGGLGYDPAKDPHRRNAVPGTPSSVLTYGDPIFAHKDGEIPYGSRVRVLGYGVWTAVELAAFQKELLFVPVPWARWLELLEVVLTSTLFALFLLAVRRQFRR